MQHNRWRLHIQYLNTKNPERRIEKDEEIAWERKGAELRESNGSMKKDWLALNIDDAKPVTTE